MNVNFDPSNCKNLNGSASLLGASCITITAENKIAELH